MFSYPEIVGVTDWPASKSGPRKSATSQKGFSWPLPLFSTSRDSSKSKETSVISRKRSANHRKQLRNNVFMSKQVRLLKISSVILQGMTKIGPKSDTGPICAKAFNYSPKNVVRKDCMVNFKKKLRNGTLDCLGNEAKFPHVFSFFFLSFSFVSLSRACPRV